MAIYWGYAQNLPIHFQEGILQQISKSYWSSTIQTTDGIAGAQQLWGTTTKSMQTKWLPELQNWTDPTVAAFLPLQRKGHLHPVSLQEKQYSARLKDGLHIQEWVIIAISYLVLFPINFKNWNGAFAVDFITRWMFPNTFCLWQVNKIRVTPLF